MSATKLTPALGNLINISKVDKLSAITIDLLAFSLYLLQQKAFNAVFSLDFDYYFFVV